jgi:hypothetical protein
MSILTDFSTFTFTVNRDDVIRLAMTDAGVLGVGEDISAEDLSYCADKLNMLVKQWQGTSDFAPGLKMWARKRADLFLQIGKIAYQLGPTGDKWVREGYWESTTITVAAAAAATTITVADPSDILTGTKIGILLSSGASHWTSANGAPAGAVVTLLAAMPSAAAAGSRVFIYEQATTRPLQLLSVLARNSNNQDRQLIPLTLDEYQALPSAADTNSKGDPLAFYYEAQLGNGMLYLDRYPADVVHNPYLHIVYLSPIEDLVMSTDTPDYPQNWYRALAAQLAMDIAPGFQVPASKELIALRNDAVLIARNHDPDVSRLFFQPYAEDFIDGRNL